MGDLGQTANSTATVAAMLADGAHFAVAAGDLSYADCDQPRWDSFGDLLEPLASAVPLMVGPGNHEVEYQEPRHGVGGGNTSDTEQLLFLAFESRYHMPEVKPATGRKPASVQWSSGGGSDDAAPAKSCVPATAATDYEFGNAW